MPYNFAADSFHTKKLCSRLSSNQVRFYTEICRFAFLRPPLGDLGATYDDHLRLIGKRVEYNTIQYKTYNAPYVTKMLFLGAEKKTSY